MADKFLKTHGGARPGAGKKAKNKVDGETKERVTIRMYPAHVNLIIIEFGSVQNWIDQKTIELSGES